MAGNPTPSHLDQLNIFQRAFDESEDRVRVDAEITANISGAQEVIISSEDDSVALGDSSGHLVGVTGNALNVFTSGSSTVSGTVDTNLNGLTAFQTSGYTVGTSAIQLTPTPLTGRSTLSIKVVATTSSDAVFIGNSSGVTTSGAGVGYPLFNGDAIQLDLTGADTIYAIGTAVGQLVYVIEMG